MNGQLFLLLISMLLQNQGSEVLPEPNRTAPSFGTPRSFPTAAPVLPQSGSSSAIEKNVGYGTDPVDGKFCLIIQIPPDSIASFATGPTGQELPITVPDEIRNFRIDKVIVRVGTNQVDRIMPTNAQARNEIRSLGSPHISTMDNRLAAIDDPLRPSAVMPTAGQGPLGSGNPGFPNNGLTNNGTTNSGNFGSGLSGNGSFGPANNDTSVMPPVNNPAARTNPFPGSNNTPSVMPGPSAMPGNAGMGTTGMGSTGYENTYNQNLNSSNNLGTSVPKDNFQSQSQSPALNILRPDRTGIANQGYPLGYPSTSNGNVGNQSNLTSGTSYPRPNVPQSNTYTGANNYTGAPFQNSYSDNSMNPQFGNYSNQANPPSLAQNQQYGSIAPPPSNYTNTNQYQTGTTPSFAGLPGSVSARPANYPPTTDPALDEQTVAKDKLLPFLLLFSIVGNVYLGLWMSHLRTRYRQLLSNMRGIPVSDLA